MMASSVVDSESFADRLSQYPSHYVWKLEEDCGRDIKHITEYVDNHLRDNPSRVPAVAKALKAYMYMSSLNVPGEKDPDEALEWLDKALQENDEEMKKSSEGVIGDRIVILADKAHTLLYIGENSEVEDIIDELSKFRKDLESEKVMAFVKAHKAFAMNWFGQMKYTEAIENYKEAIQVFPLQEWWLFGYARLLDKSGRYGHLKKTPSDEEKIYRRILKINPQNPLARVYLARKLFQKGSKFEAKFHFDYLMEHSPNQVAVIQRYAENLNWQGKPDEALELFQKALDLEPYSSFVYHQMGSIYKKKHWAAKKLAKAEGSSVVVDTHLKTSLEYFDLAITKSGGTNCNALAEKAECYVELGDKKEAKKVYRQALHSVDVDDKAKSHFKFAQFLDRHFKSESVKVIDHYKKALTTCPTGYGGQEAAKQLKKKMSWQLYENPKDLEALKLMGWVHTKYNDFDSACFYYEKAYEIDPSDHIASKLVLLYASNGNLEKSEEYRNKVDNPKSMPSIRAKSYIASGFDHLLVVETEEARKDFSRATEEGSLDGAERLLDLMHDLHDDQKYEEHWFDNCAKILHNIQHQDKLIESGEKDFDKRVSNLRAKLNDIMYPNLPGLREVYDKQIELRNACRDASEEDQDLLRMSIHMITLSRTILDRSACEFQQTIYGIDPNSNHCIYRYFKTDVSTKLNQSYEKYGWKDFRSRFKKLFLFLVNNQPGVNLINNRWVIDLFEISNRHKHTKPLTEGLTRNELVKVDDIQYEVDVVDLARLAVIKVVKIVRAFYREMPNPQVPNIETLSLQT